MPNVENPVKKSIRQKQFYARKKAETAGSRKLRAALVKVVKTWGPLK